MTHPRPAAVRATAAALAAAAVMLPGLAHAAITGGFDPEDSTSTLGTWLLTTFGSIVWVGIFLVRGLHMGLAGRAALSQIGYAVGGVILFFGAAYWLTKAGIS